MAVEATHQRPVQIQNDSEANNNNGQRLGAGFASELEAYQSKIISICTPFLRFFLTFLAFFITHSVHSETMGDLIWKKGIYYKKNTNIPFSGNITGNFVGHIQNG